MIGLMLSMVKYPLTVGLACPCCVVMFVHKLGLSWRETVYAKTLGLMMH